MELMGTPRGLKCVRENRVAAPRLGEISQLYPALTRLLRNPFRRSRGSHLFPLNRGLTPPSNIIPPLCGWVDVQSRVLRSTASVMGGVS